jgi:anti-sigma factor RsiW
MTLCDRLSDRMPLVALGRERWTAEEEAHLAACPGCAAEWTLLRAAGRIGDAAPRLAQGPDLAAAVLRRLREAPAPSPARRVPRWAIGVAAAAAVSFAVWTGGSRRDTAVVPPPDSVASMADQLGAAELDSLLDDDDPVAGWSMLEMPGMGDLDEDELEQVLRTWEG